MSPTNWRHRRGQTTRRTRGRRNPLCRTCGQPIFPACRNQPRNGPVPPAARRWRTCRWSSWPTRSSTSNAGRGRRPTFPRAIARTGPTAGATIEEAEAAPPPAQGPASPRRSSHRPVQGAARAPDAQASPGRSGHVRGDDGRHPGLHRRALRRPAPRRRDGAVGPLECRAPDHHAFSAQGGRRRVSPKAGNPGRFPGRGCDGLYMAVSLQGVSRRYLERARSLSPRDLPAHRLIRTITPQWTSRRSIGLALNITGPVALSKPGDCTEMPSRQMPATSPACTCLASWRPS